jgi:hypothetical protein
MPKKQSPFENDGFIIFKMHSCLVSKAPAEEGVQPFSTADP